MAAKFTTSQLVRRLNDGDATGVRQTLRAHLDAGGTLNAQGYAVLFSAYEDGAHDATLTQALDDVLATLDGAGGKRLLAHDDAGWMLGDMAARLLEAKRWDDTIRAMSGFYDVVEGLADEEHFVLLEAAAHASADSAREALRIHQRVVKEKPWVMKQAKLKGAAQRAMKHAKTAKVPVQGPPSTAQLLEERIRAIEAAGGAAHGFDGARYADPHPLSAAAIQKLSLPNKKKLPASLRRWLAFDASWLPLFSKRTTFDVITLRDYFRAYAGSIGLGAGVADDLAAQQERLAPSTKIIMLPSSASQDHFLAIDITADSGEMPVFGQEKEETWEKYPSFGDYVVDYLTPATKKPATKRSATKKRGSSGDEAGPAVTRRVSRARPS